MVEIILETDSISGKIQSIIREAKQELTIVSPFLKLKHWDKINDALGFFFKDKEKEMIRPTIITRSKKGKPSEELEPYLKRSNVVFVKRLHSKVYLNEKAALVTSMNLHESSANQNHEIGVFFEETEFISRIVSHVDYLKYSGIEYRSNKTPLEEQTMLEQSAKDKFEAQKFKVLSKGRKWFKVETPEGYENQILISLAPNLKENIWYEADIVKKWQRLSYGGYNVQYKEIMNLRKTAGVCIVCGDELKLNPQKPLCRPCYHKHKSRRGNIEGRYCHSCGQSHQEITDMSPQCNDCRGL